ncbi:DUF1810 domain-containing protein [Ramlibacter humi]|uniref:DUF1810 domain-containing protein n=1 Tax=Ramlibacter humi TaxID=2530451 RepID=A0A4Z0CC24_9BURK|nr:DUF1810 domain-containing protein [Ramlibacter humi]TFZ07745.1 DUF1810 domain-containing protein [Ramlibacter humi]
MDTRDAFDLQRFVDAQAPVYATALAELHAGDKRTHWMWFVFPQHEALGRSGMARRYGLRSLDEACAYWKHPLLGARLRECCEALMQVENLSAHDILGSPDDLKLRSCLTLFELAAPEEPLFARLLDRYYGGDRDERTLALCG